MSPNGELIVFLGRNGQLYLYDQKTMSHVDTLQAPEFVNCATFSDSGTKMYTHGGKLYVDIYIGLVCIL